MLIKPKKYLSDFVKKQREISSRLQTKVAWDAKSITQDKIRVKGYTYIKSKHGELK